MSVNLLQLSVLFVRMSGHIPALSCAPDLRVADCLSMILRQMFPHAFEGNLHAHAATNAVTGMSHLLP